LARIVVMYNPPADAAAFDSYYFGTHVPIAKKIPGLKRYIVNHGPVMAMDGSSPYHLVAELEFDSMAAIQQAMGTPEGQATATDVANFATGGVTILMFDDKEV
jgi:uncharacterized protein (TIGR02118 family)